MDDVAHFSQWKGRLMAWTKDQILAVWRKGKVVKGDDGSRFRLDDCGAWMSLVYYGDRDSRYGWEIDHIDPDGGDGIDNLRPLQWENNCAKSDGKLKCVVTNHGRQNIRIDRPRGAG